MKRFLTAAVALPAVVLITVFSSDWFFAAFISAASVLAVDEFLSLAAIREIGRPGRWFLVPAAFVTLSFLAGPGAPITALAAATIILMASTVFSPATESALGRAGIGIGAVVYCSLSLGFLLMLPREAILVLLAIVWVGDAAAYYAGRAFGRHRLAPRVSPNKTIEGAVAGLIGSLGAGVLGGAWLLRQSMVDLVGFSIATALAGQLGDLAESVLKRSAGAKDSSSILPGHGGILDRLDSLFFAAPVFYWLLNT
jgi:phosphatidate cytidylyltransferase